MPAPRRAAVLLLVTAILAVLGAADVGAAPGDLDTSFGGDGAVTTEVGGDDHAFAAVLQSDGKLVLAGTTKNGGASNFALARYNTDGTLDSSFGGSGIVVTDLGGGDEELHAITTDGNGALIAAGISDAGGDTDIVLLRYTSSGALDPSFGTGGKVFTDLAGGDDGALALVRHAGGKIAVAGFAFTGIFTDLAVARYGANGLPDSSFGSGGVSTTAIGFDTAMARALVAQADGKLVAVGTADFGSIGDEMVLVRLTTGGAPDSSFDGDGIATATLTGSDDIARAASIQTNGRIVVAGQMPAAGSHHVVLLRRLSNGGPDSSFDLDGTALYLFGSGSSAHGVLAQSDGRIVVAGERTAGGHSDVLLLRLEADGTLDPNFGNGGVVITPIGAGDDSGETLLAAGSRLVVAGSSFNGSNDDFAVLRYIGSDCSDGSVDAGEECDDGNTAAGDCCSPSCQFESAATACAADSSPCSADHCNGAGACVHTPGNAGLVCRPAAGVCDAAETCTGSSSNCPADGPAPNGTSCADSLFCNGTETCQNGACQPATSPCSSTCDEEQDFCPSACPPFARSDCRTAERNEFQLRHATKPENHRIKFRWLRGAPTSQAELADPRTSASYLLCVYEGASGALAAQAIVAPSASRWSVLGPRQDRGFRFRDLDSSGLRYAVLRPSADNSASAVVKGRGADLPDAGQPLELPVTVQLSNSSSDVCLGSRFTSARRNDGILFRP